jgi:predicted NUDIX family phosphoesterase
VNENVLVVPTAGINPFLTGTFTSSTLDRCLDYILHHQSFRSRALVEDDNTWKQIIPYVIVRHNDRHLLTRRTNRQTESRLHGKYSVGVGGHINDAEKFAPDQNVIEAGLERELDEEIHLLGHRRSLNLVGIISDDSTPVGQVHLGLVFLLETESPDFTVNEADLMTAEWAGFDKLRECFASMETWSQIVFQEIISRPAVHAPDEVALK